jgi:hypothetical protein
MASHLGDSPFIPSRPASISRRGQGLRLSAELSYYPSGLAGRDGGSDAAWAVYGVLVSVDGGMALKEGEYPPVHVSLVSWPTGLARVVGEGYLRQFWHRGYSLLEG